MTALIADRGCGCFIGAGESECRDSIGEAYEAAVGVSYLDSGAIQCAKHTTRDFLFRFSGSRERFFDAVDCANAVNADTLDCIDGVGCGGTALQDCFAEGAAMLARCPVNPGGSDLVRGECNPQGQ